ncbi:dual specificity phosphatase, catalytic domain protein [Dictyocaulus viviparus]|uniref:protein-tyrosine-phosphatase n=1 Tax=Dictyocaulus viviparus TaxID=29172 RepID=A0A0D8XZC6_DICVI|nr:dual specificity phosphatase, catalytic domain protein [Dictyocaulus viviparus]
MVSTSAPSTSFHRDEVISGSELNHLMTTDSLSICILDCRAEGSVIRSSNRIRLPNVLYRRLINCSLSLSTLSPRLNNADVKVVIVPEQGSDCPISNAIANALRKASINYRVVKEPIETVLSSFPLLRVDGERPNSQSADVGCLNLNALQIEPGVAQYTDKRQVFPVQILPHLFLGNYETASDAQLLDRMVFLCSNVLILFGSQSTILPFYLNLFYSWLWTGVHYIINVTSNLPNKFENDPAFHYQRISVDDNSSHNLSHYFPGWLCFSFFTGKFLGENISFPEAIAFIDAAASAGDACLVHCLAGISRSVTICLAYLMTKNKWSLEDAYDLVLRRNASIAPNFHFMGQLSEYERYLGIRGSSVDVVKVVA